MAYKTFEDMKHDIPEGATHYNNENDELHFAWYKSVGGTNYILTPAHSSWWHALPNQKDMYLSCVKPIPQTETPEEKEAFDSMTNNSEFPNSSEWKNGDECMIRGEKLIYIGESIEADIHCVQELGTCLYRNAHISVIEKPETPQQREERERLEAAYDLYLEFHCAVGRSVVSLEDFEGAEFALKGYLSIVDKTGYRKAK